MVFFKKTWEPGNKITTTELNRMETGIDDITKQSVKTVNSTPPDANGNVIISAPVGSVDWPAITNKPNFATVSTSGSYDDLSNKPVIPAPYVLPAATDITLGGVIGGTGVTIDADGTINASSGGSTDVPISYVLSADLTVLSPGTYAVCTDTKIAYMGTALGNIELGPVSIPTTTDNGGGGSTPPVTPTIITSDGFTRATDSATSVGTSDIADGGTAKPWNAFVGTTMGTISGALYNSSTSGAAVSIDAGVSDKKMVVTVSNASNEIDFYFRANQTTKQYYRYAHNTLNGGTWFLQESAGTFTTIKQFAGTLAANDVVTLSVNGTVIDTVNALTDLLTNTCFGLGFSGSTASRIDKVDIYNMTGTGGGGAGDTTAPVLTITPAASFTTSMQVTMSTNETATIYYTTNGTAPTTSSPVYSAPITITATTTVRAFAKDTAGNMCPIQTVTYTLSAPTVSTRPTNYLSVSASNGTDDTTAIQNTINSAVGQGKAIIVPAGTYKINPAVGINLPSNTTIYFDSGAVFQSLATSNSLYKIINMVNVSNVNIIGYPKIIGDRDIHTGTGGESGMGIALYSASNVYIENANISKCWGDGIYLGDSGGAQRYNSNVTIKNVVCDNNRRQGISVISAIGLTITSPTLINTNGTDPQSGIDFEPNNTSQYLQNIVMTDPFIQNNANHGIHFWIGFGPGSNPISITITNASNVKNNAKGNIYFGGTQSNTVGFVKIDGTYYLNK
jgi:hypothetical protein